MKFPGWKPPEAAKSRLRGNLIAFGHKSPDELNPPKVATKYKRENDIADDRHDPSAVLQFNLTKYFSFVD
jgi:hypothetical protein